MFENSLLFLGDCDGGEFGRSVARASVLLLTAATPLIKYPHGYLITGSAMTDTERLARIFRLMSVGTRVRMIQLLKRRSLCVNALAHALEVTPAAISQHLRLLRDAGIVTARKQGYFVHYCVNEKALARWREATDGLLRLDE
jgi:ArsR family transcriptional regulator